MKSTLCWGRKFISIGMIFLLMQLFSACTPGGNGPTGSSPSKFVYANLDESTNNYVAGYSINSDGTLTELSGSPFATGGAGINGGWFGAKAIAIAHKKNLLFVSNKHDNTITVFSIDPSTGVLTAVGSPVSSGGTMSSSGSLAVDANDNFLFIGNNGSNNISVFSIASNGTLTAVTASPFTLSTDSSINGIALNTSGDKLFVAQMDGNTMAVLSVAPNGTLTEVSASPFPYTGNGKIASIAFVSDSLGLSAAYAPIDVNDLTSYSIDANGVPTVVDSLALNNNNQCVTVTPSGNFAVVSGGNVTKISVIQVASSGTLTQVSGSPFTTKANTSGYAVVSSSDKYVYATEWSQVEAFSMDSAGTLTSLGTYSTSAIRMGGIEIY